MSATLTWYNSGLGAKTGTTIATMFADLVTLVGTKSADSNFLWEVKGSNTGSTPYYVSLGRKDGSAGRIAVIAWSSAPAGNNSAILDGAPATNQVHMAYFPAGTGTTLANLTASSGAITGDDTGVVKCTPGTTVANYSASVQWFYFESAGGIFFGIQNPASSACYGSGAGDLLVDAADTAYGCTIGYGATNSMVAFGGATGSNTMAWAATAPLSGTATSCIKTNYGSTGRSYYHAWTPSSGWAASAVGANDILTNTGTADAWFVPVQLLGNTKGEGMVVKLRQIAYGPGTTGQFAIYNTTGPVVAARQFCAATAGAAGSPWFVNSKI